MTYFHLNRGSKNYYTKNDGRLNCFKWIKQHLRIKAIYGTSRNAVFTQIWIAICMYLLVAIVKKRMKLEPPLYTLLQIFGLTLFEKMPINELFTNTNYNLTSPVDSNQLNIWEF